MDDSEMDSIANNLSTVADDNDKMQTNIIIDENIANPEVENLTEKPVEYEPDTIKPEENNSEPVYANVREDPIYHQLMWRMNNYLPVRVS